MASVEELIRAYVYGVPETGAGNVLIAGDIPPIVQDSIRENIIEDIMSMPPEWQLYFVAERPKMVFADMASLRREGRMSGRTLGFYNPVPMAFLGHIIDEPAIYSGMVYYQDAEAEVGSRNIGESTFLTYDMRTFAHELGHYADDASYEGMAGYWSDRAHDGIWDKLASVTMMQYNQARRDGTVGELPEHIQRTGSYMRMRRHGGSHAGRELYAFVNEVWLQKHQMHEGEESELLAEMEGLFGKDIWAVFQVSRGAFAEETQASIVSLQDEINAYVGRSKAISERNGLEFDEKEAESQALLSYASTGLMPDVYDRQVQALDIDELKATYRETFKQFALTHELAVPRSIGNLWGLCVR